MQHLIFKLKELDYNKLRKFILKIGAYELSNLSEDCYYPKTKKNYFELLSICNLTNKDIIEYTKRFYYGSPAATWKLQRDPYSNLLIIIMHIFLIKKDIIGYQSTMLYFMIRYYSNLMHKQIKWCNKDVFRYTLENITKIHLFVREKTIPNSLYYLSKEMENHHTNDIKEMNVDGIISFISKSRHRISQSVKSFAESYYRFSKVGLHIKTQKDETEDIENKHQYQVLEKGERIIDQVVKEITMYKNVDKKAIEEARNLSRVKNDISIQLVNSLSNIKYSDSIKIILKLFLDDLKDVKSLCGKQYYEFVKKLMSLKRSNLNIYYKQQIELLILKIIEDTDYSEKYKNFTLQTQFSIKSFLSYYLTLLLRNKIC